MRTRYVVLLIVAISIIQVMAKVIANLITPTIEKWLGI